jgi:hypothetical protein
MKPDPSGLPNTYLCDPGETIQVFTTIDNAPFLAGFPDHPYNGKWESVTPDWGNLKDTRTFVCSGAGGAPISFTVSHDEQIPDDAPYDSTKYTKTFTSVTKPGDAAILVPIVVPKGLGPIMNQYTFKVA